MTERHDPIEADMARLADGSLGSPRREEVERLVSVEGRQADLEQQRSVAALLRAADDPAPAELRRRLVELAGSKRRRPRRKLLLLPAGVAAAAAAAAVVLLLALPGGTSVPTVAEAARLALRPPTAAAPAVDPARPEALLRAVGGVRFPSWTSKRWQAVGYRGERQAGRRLLTVTYRGPGGGRASYLIADGAPLPSSGGRTVWRYGVAYRLLEIDGAHVVTWLRGGHTCVIVSHTTAGPKLVALAE